MMFKTVAFLALAATTLAHPGKHALHRHKHHGTGIGTGAIAAPTGGASENGTDAGNGGAFGAGSSAAAAPAPATTQTVVPVAASSPPAPVVQVAPSVAPVASSIDPVASDVPGPGGVATVAASSSPVAAEKNNLVASSSSSCSSTMTSTFTAVNYITMTVSSGTSTISAAGGNVQAFQPSSPAVPAGPYPAVSSAAVSPAGFYQPSSSVAAAASPATVSPAGFFQKSSAAAVPSVSYGNFGSPSAQAMTTFATSVAGPSPVASSAPAVSSSAPSSSGPSGGKKGLSYNSASLTDAFANTGMSWAYNWAAAPAGTLVSGVSYVPMLWGLKSLSTWNSAVATAISAGSSAALSFNEPDLATQSNLDPATAATNHIKYMNPLSVPVGSPAVTNGAGTSPLMGIDWLNAFFDACNGQCKVDFVAFHWYADASDTAYFQQHVMDVIGNASAHGVEKVWLTEFGTTGGDTAGFLQTVLPFLESTPQVEKYAFFMCASPQTLSGSSLNSVGQVYASG